MRGGREGERGREREGGREKEGERGERRVRDGWMEFYFKDSWLT